MDKKKLLLVAISVGIFLVIAIGAAILVFAPGKEPPPSSVAAGYPASGGQGGFTVPSPSFPPPFSGLDAPAPLTSVDPVSGDTGTAPDPVDMVKNPGDVPGLSSPPQGTVPQDGGGTGVAAQTETGNSGTVINVPKPTSAAVPDTPPAGRAVSAPAPRATPKPAAPVKAAPKPPAQPKVYDDYWVQTGAFSTVAKAEGVKETLASKGITSIIENREMEGKTLFRVRVGPYTSQNEADYWLSLIKTIGGFEDSQVRQTQSRR